MFSGHSLLYCLTRLISICCDVIFTGFDLRLLKQESNHDKFWGNFMRCIHFLVTWIPNRKWKNCIVIAEAVPAYHCIFYVKKISVSFGTGNLHWNSHMFNLLTYRYSIKLMYLFYLLLWQCWIYDIDYEFYWPAYKRNLYLDKNIVRLRENRKEQKN